MKFLHLSDLHIGKNVNGFSMLEEQCHAFEQITGYIRSENPDAVIIAGDIYDRAVPGVDAVRVFDDFLTALAGEDTAVLIISGNHDSPERLSYASRLLSEKRLFIYGAFDGTVHKVTLNDEYGTVDFWLLPFIKPLSMRGLCDGRVAESYSDAVSAALETADIDYTKRNVLISHQFYTKAGFTPEQSESELNPIGGLDAVDAGLIELFDYAALGHLHGGQYAGGGHIRYCGSPVKYSFSECRQDKSVTLAQLGRKGCLNVKTLPLTPLRDMREITGTLEKLISGVISCLADRNDYLRVILTDEQELINPMDKLRCVYPNIMSLSFENVRTNINLADIKADGAETEKLSSYDLFSEFFLSVQGTVMSTEQAAIVRELLEKDVS